MELSRHLETVPVFEGIPEAQLRELARKMELVDIPPGAVILEEGGGRRSFFVILEGRVRVVKNHGRRSEKELNRLGPGAYFGEMSLLDHGAPSATIVADGPVRGCALLPGDFLAFLDAHPRVADLLIANLSRRVRRIEEAGISEMVAAQEAVIIGLAKLTEFRDPETGWHLERIRHHCRLLAEAAGAAPEFREEVDREYVEIIFKASPLHDIGKVGVPDAVLRAPRRLTSEEVAVMQRHPEIGAAAIRQAMERLPNDAFLAMGHDIALGHHERVDGRGYPQGAAGEGIPLCARIMAVADVYDAFRSNRVYRPALSHEETRKILLEGRDGQFDRRLVDLFLSREREVAAIHDAMPDESLPGSHRTAPG